MPNNMDPELNNPGSMTTNGNGNVLTERPHTISSAYEKGHQRPSLQPYTFNPPESALTIQESDGEHLVVVGPRQPPPPRYVDFKMGFIRLISCLKFCLFITWALFYKTLICIIYSQLVVNYGIFSIYVKINQT